MVGRPVPQHDPVALGQRLAAELGVARDVAAHVHHRARVADDLLDRGRVQRLGVGPQARPFLRVLVEQPDAVRDAVARGLAARGRQGGEEPCVVTGREPVAGAVLVLDLGVDEHRGEVVTGLVESSAPELVRVRAHLLHHPDALADREAVRRVADPERPHQAVEQPRLVGVGDAQQPADHLQGERHRERIDEIELLAVAERVEQRDARGADLVGHPLDHAWRESLVDDQSQLRVLGRIEVQDAVARALVVLDGHVGRVVEGA